MIQPYTVTKDTIASINILVYGHQGVGKTYFAAGAQDVPTCETSCSSTSKRVL